MNREEALKILINSESEPCYKTCDEDCGKVMICLNHKCKWAEAMDVIREALKDRPHGEWIPCSDRLPKRDELVLVSYRGEVHFCKYLDDGSENTWWDYIYDSCIWNNDIVAWMPLPEPYKKEGEAK